jgi:DNA-binding transcriptional ArsR family regulator
MVRSTVPRSTQPHATRSTPIVRDFRGASAGYRIEWDVRPVYDFVFSLSDEAGASEDLPALDRRWLADARASLPEPMATDRTALLASELCIQVAELIVEQPGIAEPADLVAAVAALDRHKALRYIASDVLKDARTTALAHRAVDGDDEALSALGEALPEYRRSERLALVRDPDSVIRRLVAVLAAWQRPFAEIEPRVVAMLRRDVEARAEDARTLAPGDLIEKTTGGLRYTPEPNIQRVILAPSYFARPYNFLFSNDDWRLYGYPIADSSLDSADPLEPPPAVVRLHRALGDPSRLRILRILADGDRYLTEIAQALELSKPTVKHHMALLRAAGLVTLTEEASLTYYSLRRDRLDEVGTDLRRFITA